MYYLKIKTKNDFGLHHHDGLAVLKNKSALQSEQVKKSIQKISRGHGLDIIIQCNMKIVNYLDVIVNLNDGTCKPHKKENNEIKYIHNDSNHQIRGCPPKSTIHRIKVIHTNLGLPLPKSIIRLCL